MAESADITSAIVMIFGLPAPPLRFPKVSFASSSICFAVIDIGSSAIRLLIAQGGPSEWALIEDAELPLALGRDVFRRGTIEHAAINRAVEILKGFRELAAPYTVDRIAAIGTSAIRESANCEMLIDRVLLQTGIKVRVVDGVEANRFTWLAVREPLSKAITAFRRHGPNRPNRS